MRLTPVTTPPNLTLISNDPTNNQRYTPLVTVDASDFNSAPANVFVAPPTPTATGPYPTVGSNTVPFVFNYNLIAAPTAVPTMEAAGLALLSGLMVGGAALARRRRERNAAAGDQGAR